MMDKIITIGREHGSGGRAVGKRVAQKLGIDYYDGLIVSEAARAGGLDEKLAKAYDEKPTSTLLYALSLSFSVPGITHTAPVVPIGEQVYYAQCEFIRRCADKPCVIVGRCADYILAGRPNLYRVFVRADLEDRVRRIMSTYEYSEEKAREVIRKTDKERANYYNYHTDKAWGDMRNYDLCLSSSGLDLDVAADLVIKFAESRA